MFSIYFLSIFHNEISFKFSLLVSIIISTFLYQIFINKVVKHKYVSFFENLFSKYNFHLQKIVNEKILCSEIVKKSYPTINTDEWQPIMEKESVKINFIQTVDFFGTKIILFKDINKKIHVYDAFCLGIDLSVTGFLDQNSNIFCTFNDWRFDTNGVLSSIGNRGKSFLSVHK